VIAVGSGKGGVGKSTVATNLATGLRKRGLAVGLLDADIYGPSLPLMMGDAGSPKLNEQNKLVPPFRHGVAVMSFGFFAESDQATVWRGPMVGKAVRQFLFDVAWPELDVLIVDLPPGTGDVPLTLTEEIEIAGAIVVTTPQEVAAVDAAKALAMFARLHIPVVGLVENMAEFVCSHCGQATHIFEGGSAAQLAERFSTRVLCKIPLVPAIAQSGDHHIPSVLAGGGPWFSGVVDAVGNLLVTCPSHGAGDLH
jgi:ATP-binding protein involved in chromosome partitioning